MKTGSCRTWLTKMVDVIAKYATQNGYAMVVDVSNQQSPLIWADQAYVITDAIVKLYDQAHPGAAPAAAAPAVKPPVCPGASRQETVSVLAQAPSRGMVVFHT